MLTQMHIKAALPFAAMLATVLYGLFQPHILIAILPGVLFILTLGLPWIILSVIVHNSSAEHFAKWGICILPIFATFPAAGLNLSGTAFFAINFCVCASCFVLTYLALGSIISKKAQIVFTTLLFALFLVEQSILANYIPNEPAQNWEVASPVKTAAYHSEYNSFTAAKPAYWILEDETSAITDPKQFNRLKSLLEDYLEGFINKTDTVYDYYHTHTQLKAFRENDAGAAAWDKLHITNKLEIKELYYREGVGNYEFLLKGTRTIIPNEKSQLSSALVKPFSYSLNIYKTGEGLKKWTVFYVRNNKIN